MSLAQFAQIKELQAALAAETAKRLELEERVAALEAKRGPGRPPNAEKDRAA